MRTEDVQITAPCEEDWERMSPDAGGRKRFCDACNKQVHDLSAMDERSAEAFWAATARMDICISYLSDEHGQLLFASPAPQAFVELGRVRVRAQPKPSPRRSLAAASLGAALAACTPHGEELTPLEIDEQVLEEASAPSPPPVVVPPARELDPPTRELTDEPCEAEQREPLTPKTHLRKKGRRITRTAGIPLRNSELPL